jgi:hypothetical protein
MYSSEFDEVRAPIITEGLQLYVDPSKTECIQRNFNTRVTDLSSNLLNGTIVAGPGISGDFIVYNGSTQYITFGNNTANLDLSSKTFTAWIFPSAFTTINPIIGKWYASGGWAFQINTSGRLIFSIGGTDYVDTGPPLIANIWYFVAVTYDYANNIATFYKNGSVTSSVLNRAIIEASSSTELLQIGASRGTLTAPRLFFNGAIGPLYAYNRVLTRDEILTNFNVDKDRTIFFNRNLSGSIFFNGSTDYLSVPSANIPALSGQFTIEFWVNFSSISGTNQTICGKWRTSFFGWIIQINNTECRFFYGDGVNFLSSIGYATTFSSGLWYHIAITRNSSNAIQAYLNGSAIGSPSTVSNSFNSAVPFLIASNDGGQLFNGYITDFRIVNGTAVYTSNFTVPSSPLTAISGTSLLLNSLTSSTYMKDSSANNLTVTSVGTTSYSSLNPFSTLITSNTTNITKWAKTERSSGALMTRGYLDENTGVNTVNVAISGAVSATWTTYQTTSYAFTANGTYFIIPNGDVVMTAKVWGAAGAGSTAGAGGYSTGDIYMAADSLYTVVVGGGGINSGDFSGGGGFSGLFVTDTSGNTSIISQTQALMIAGGGGGASVSDPGTGKGAAGGGLTGQDGQTWSGPGSTGGGLGGTQTAGGRATGPYANTGSALQGGSGSGSGTQVAGGTPGGGGAGLNTSWGGSGGGGGYWGGGAGQSTVTFLKGFGGGGSGYLHPILVTNGATIAGNNSIVANASDVDRGTTAGSPTSTIGGSGRIVLSVKRVINSPGLRGSSVAAVSSISYVTSGLIIMYDAAIASSYSGSGTTWTDIGSSGNSGTLVGATYNPAGYFAFNGSSTYMYATNSIPNINTTNFTLSGWFQMSAAGGSGKIVGFESNQTGTFSASWDKMVYVNSSGQLVWAVNNTGSTVTIASSTAVNNGVWHHYAAIYNYSGNQIQLYVDGVSVATTNARSTDAGTWLRFGSYKQAFWPGVNDGYWTGNMSNFMMYNRVLTAPEVSQNFNAFRSRYGV